MGKNLHYSIINFIKQRLHECNKINSYILVPNTNHYVIEVKRNLPYESFKIYMSDEYRYTITDYYNKPTEINKGDFIYLARPEANFANEIEIMEAALSDGIYIGKFSRLLSFMNRSLKDAEINTINHINKLKEEEKERNRRNL